MSCRQYSKLEAPADKERIRADQQRIGFVVNKRPEYRLRANFVLLESGGIPDALSMSESLGIDSFLGASDAEALFHRLAWPSD